ncbi:MAG: hypothetical protein SVW77_02515 [Candidatus Nanohaloarchaea archaeon]|nr:hypothetical protein [Candidatus Nanohaloarchaea archaeon]
MGCGVTVSRSSESAIVLRYQDAGVYEHEFVHRLYRREAHGHGRYTPEQFFEEVIGHRPLDAEVATDPALADDYGVDEEWTEAIVLPRSYESALPDTWELSRGDRNQDATASVEELLAGNIEELTARYLAPSIEFQIETGTPGRDPLASLLSAGLHIRADFPAPGRYGFGPPVLREAGSLLSRMDKAAGFDKLGLIEEAAQLSSGADVAARRKQLDRVMPWERRKLNGSLLADWLASYLPFQAADTA